MPQHPEILKQKALHIILTFVLIANLLFSQVVINLLHGNHYVSASKIELQKGQTAIQKHTERCKICALDIVFNLLFNSSIQCNSLPIKDTFIVSHKVDVNTTLISFFQGRAPPVFISDYL